MNCDEKKEKIQSGDSSISFLAGLHRQISVAGNNYTPLNNTNKPCPN